MKHDILVRYHLVLGIIRRYPEATRGYLQARQALREAELRRALICLKHSHWIAYRGRGEQCQYTLTAEGESWWQAHQPEPPPHPEQVELCEKRRKRALQLEAQQFWYRAARQWLLVLDLCTDDAARTETVAHRERCLHLARLKTRAPSALASM